MKHDIKGYTKAGGARRSLRRAAIGMAAAALALVAPATPTAPTPAPVAYIVQAPSAEQATEAVMTVGGELTRTGQTITWEG